jgi:foldase protein PrsA
VNNSKHLKAKKEKKDRLVENKPITKFSLPWIIVSAVVLVAIIIGLLFDQFYERTVMTIDGKDYKMSDLAYYFYTVESTYDYYDQMFGGNGAYWDMTYNEDTGETVREAAKQEAVDNVLYNEILYKEALAEGYTLSDEEKTTVQSDVNTLLTSTLTSSQISKNKITEAKLTAALEKIALVTRFRADKIDTFDIDDAAIKDTINYDEYKQYDIETLFISTKTTDADGNSVDMTDEEKQAAYDKLNSYYETAKTTDDWSTLLPEDEKAVTYSDTNFVEKTSNYDETMTATMVAMNNGDISNIITAADGYYVVRMKNNNSSESDKFDEYYQGVKANHKYSTNEKALASMTMGSITLD